VRQQISRIFEGIPEGYVCLGYVSGFFGTRGELRIFLYNPESDLLRSPRDVCLLGAKGDLQKCTMTVRTGAGKRIIAKLRGFENRSAVEDLKEKKILIRREALPALTDGEWYHHELLGLPVRTESGLSLGPLIEIVTGDVDFWVVESEDETHYIPNTKEEVLSVDLVTGIVVADASDAEDG
jgi:16S rRNA processing protein RimM